jgi:hypothetical protein
MPRVSKNANITLWTIQGILALIFLLAGAGKLVLPATAFRGPIALPIALPTAFIRFIGVCEFAGSLGLILPGLLNIRPRLTPLAACGLVGVMTGATALSAIYIGVPAAIVPFTAGALALAVVYGRSRRGTIRFAAINPVVLPTFQRVDTCS